MSKLEEANWRIAGTVRRIFAGERDPAALIANLDEQDSALIRRDGAVKELEEQLG